MSRCRVLVGARLLLVVLGLCGMVALVTPLMAWQQAEGQEAFLENGQKEGKTENSPAGVVLSAREAELESRRAAREMAQQSPWTGIPLLETTGAFLFVLCLAALGALAVGHLMKGRGVRLLSRKQPRKYDRINVLETVPLGQKRHLAVVQAGGEFHLLGLGPGQVNYLTKLPSKTRTEAHEESKRPTAETPSLIHRLVKPTQAATQAEGFQAHYQQLRARLQKR